MINKSRTPPFGEKRLLCISPNLVMSEWGVRHLQSKMQVVEPQGRRPHCNGEVPTGGDMASSVLSGHLTGDPAGRHSGPAVSLWQRTLQYFKVITADAS